jgi:Bacteriophage head to tail connecting protein
VRRVLNVDQVVQRDRLACIIGEKYDAWRQARTGAEKMWKEVQSYIFATDTTTTTNSKLPWKNKTTRPKLCQIRDNLHANYMAAIFPNDDWFRWRPEDSASADMEKAQAITAYMKQKFWESKFEQTVSRCVLDFIDYGNVVGDAEYVEEIYTTPEGEETIGYVGPRLVRISPYDVVFDVTSQNFENSPKISRALLTIGDIEAKAGVSPEWAVIADKVLPKIKEARRQVAGYDSRDVRKTDGLVADGYGTLFDYYSSGLVEVLEFEGDLYDQGAGKLYPNHVITIFDRAYEGRNEPIKNWIGRSTKQHVAWRLRPDNLMGMGPLDNLVGMQYRIDHLENLRADMFDLTAYPVFKIRGYVEDFEYGPLERIYMEGDADVDFMRPDTLALNADMQIQELEAQMELMAGAPKQAMGFRSPGEKTKFEVQTLDNAANRTFLFKAAYFERNFLEPLLNAMLEKARREMNQAELIRIMDTDLGITKFLEITPQDIRTRGKLVPMGARQFAAQAQLVQNLSTLAGTGLYQDDAIKVHFSGIKMAQLLEENLGLKEFGIVQPNIRVTEQADTANLMQSAQEQVQVNGLTPTMDEGDIPDAAT